MKKYRLIFWVTCLILVFVASGCTKRKEISTQAHGNIIDMRKDFSSAKKESDVIITGKVKSSHSYKLEDVVFTNYIIEVDRVIKGANKNTFPKEIEIRYTGDFNNSLASTMLEESKVPDLDANFLFMLKKVFPQKADNNYYAVLGGEHQGLLKVDLDTKGQIKKLIKFNDKNTIEKEIINKDIEDILNTN